MHRFFVTEQDFIDETVALVRNPELMHQWKQVLRFQKGEKVVLLRGDGEEYEMVIQAIEEDGIKLELIERRFSKNELPVRVVLAQSFLKHVDKFELVLQKGTELGVAAFVPLLTNRTEKRMEAKRARWEKIIKEAAEQSGRAVIPVLEPTASLKDIIASHEFVVIPHTKGEKNMDEVFEGIKTPSHVLYCIGPEGGFTDEEIMAAQEAGAYIVSLGPRTLRAETASIVSVALLPMCLKN